MDKAWILTVEGEQFELPWGTGMLLSKHIDTLSTLGGFIDVPVSETRDVRIDTRDPSTFSLVVVD